MTATPESSPAGSRVAVCDDDAMDRMLIETVAQSVGVSVDVTASREELLACLVAAVERGAPHSVVLCDLHMPGMGLDELIAEMSRHETLSTIPLVVWSEHIRDARRNELMAAGVTRIERKTPDIDQMEEIIRRLAAEA